MNFWPAIHDGLIEFRIGEQIVTAENLGSLMAAEKGQREVELEYPYYRSLVDGAAGNGLKQICRAVGACRLHLLFGKRESCQKKVRLVRATEAW